MTQVTTSATYKTLVTANLPDFGSRDITFRLVAAFFNAAGEEVIDGTTYTMTLDASGVDDGSFYLPTPDNTGDAGANWFVTLPSGFEDIVTVAYSGAAQAVSDLLAAGSTTTDPDVIVAAIAGKATKVNGATADNLASLTSGGDLADSGAAAANVPTDNEKSWLTAGEAGGALGTAAYAATGDFDAAGSAAAAQAAAIAASDPAGTAAAMVDDLSGVTNVTTARLNLDIPVQPSQTIRVIGDSIAASASVSELQSALKGATVSTFAIGGETSAEIYSRVKGVTVVRPARTATLSGTVDIVVAENVPPRMINSGYSASWQDYSTNQMLQIDSVSIYNHDKRLGGAMRRKLIGVCNYATSADTINLYNEVTGGRTLTPEKTFEAYAPGTNVATLPSFSSIGRIDAVISGDYAHTGSQSAKMTINAVGAFNFLLRNGTQTANLAITSIYEADMWIYVPTAFTGVTETLRPSTTDEIVWLDGTSDVNLATDVGSWKRMHFMFKLPSGTVQLRIQSNSIGGDVGKSFYVDDLRVMERYEFTGLAPTATDTIYAKKITDATTGLSSGLSEYRRYYIVSPGASTTKLALTSGGAAVDLGSDGMFELYEAFHLSWVPSAPDTTTHYLTARAESGDYDAFALIWSGHNDVTTPADTIANIQATVDEWRNKHGDRFAVLTLVNRFAYGESFYHDSWEWVRQWIISRYPHNHVDCYQAALDWGLAQATSSQDYKDALNGRVPASLLSDGVHPNSTGYTVMFVEPVKAFLLAGGWFVAA